MSSPPQDDDHFDPQQSERLRETLDTLHREMDVAEYSRTKSGQRKRVTPKELSKGKTRKRKLLEQEDAQQAYHHLEDDYDDESDDDDDNGDDGRKKTARLRGSRVSLEDAVIEGSLPLAAAASSRSRPSQPVEDEEGVSEDEADDSGDDEEDDAGSGEEEEEDQEMEEEVGTQNATEVESSPSKEAAAVPATKKTRGPYKKRTATAKKQKNTKKPGSNSKKGRRRLYKLKNFKSFRMAQRHGDALGAHARGLPQLAIAELKKVARDAPSAPQVYSSLGMVYRDMFVTARDTINAKKHAEEPTAEVPEKDAADDLEGADASTSNNHFVPVVYREALDLAKRAYGSYHIAAILCKKDYDLWIRAADTACDIADLMGDMSVIHNNAEARDVLLCKKEQEQWYNEAKNDLQTADNLKPPGLDVPIKLASVYMELGHFSEALTLWTDLLQRSSLTEQFRHTAWLLYAECMLHIGHECQQWNAGNEANDNYMFRRWLRKWSSTFDWQERRLQALVLAMEAAAGSNACRHLMAWMRHRDVDRRQEIEKRKIEQQQYAAEKKTTVTFAKEDSSKSTVDGRSMLNDSSKTGNVPPSIPDTDVEEDIIYPDEMNVEDTPDPMAPIEGDAEYEGEKALLLQNNELELNAFDQTTANMKQVLGNDNGDDGQSDKTSALKERRDARKKIVAQHQRLMSKLDDEYKKRTKDGEGLAREAGAKVPLQEDSLLESQHLEASAYTDGRSSPLAASCRTITSIAAELMKHLLEMELYKGGRMAGEAVALYMKERAKVHDKKIEDRKKRNQQANPLGSLLTQTLNYDEVSIDKMRFCLVTIVIH